jgi:hypothetical protein
MSNDTALVVVKLTHTIVWGLFAGAILALPWFIGTRRWKWAAILISAVLIECVVLWMNGMRCPLSDTAARYTKDRTDNFDIYLPQLLARYNKTIFGTMFGIELLWAGAARFWGRGKFARPDNLSSALPSQEHPST